MTGTATLTGPQIENEERHVWMVAATPLEAGCETPTFGPFPTFEDAQAFADEGPGRRWVYDDVQNRRSLCGPWLP